MILVLGSAGYVGSAVIDHLLEKDVYFYQLHRWRFDYYNFSELLSFVEQNNITIILEPLNTVDHQGYFLDSSDFAAEIIREINHPNLKMLFDIYHMQMIEGNVINHIERHIDIIGHFHSAGVPGRHELYIGELNYRNIVKRIEELGYDGVFSLEYFPTVNSHESLEKVLEACLKQ